MMTWSGRCVGCPGHGDSDGELHVLAGRSKKLGRCHALAQEPFGRICYLLAFSYVSFDSTQAVNLLALSKKREEMCCTGCGRWGRGRIGESAKRGERDNGAKGIKTCVKGAIGIQAGRT